MSIGENMKKRRLSLGMTLEEVADKVGVSRQTMSRYETGVIKNYSPEKVADIAKALNTTGSYLLGYIEDPDILPEFWTLRLPDGKNILTKESPDIEAIKYAHEYAINTLIAAIEPICAAKMFTQSGAEFSILKQDRVDIVVDFIKRNLNLLKAQIETQERK